MNHMVRDPKLKYYNPIIKPQCNPKETREQTKESPMQLYMTNGNMGGNNSATPPPQMKISQQQPAKSKPSSFMKKVNEEITDAKQQ